MFSRQTEADTDESSQEGPDDSSSSSASSDDDESSLSALSSAASDEDRSASLEPHLSSDSTLQRLRRRRSPVHEKEEHEEDGDSDKKQQTTLARHLTLQRRRWGQHRLSKACSGIGTLLLCTSMIVWTTLLLMPPPPTRVVLAKEQLTTRERTHLRTRYSRDMEPTRRHVIEPRRETQKKRSSVEDLKPGCVRPEWQEFNFPTCNDVHEIDLASIVERQGQRVADVPLGYLSSGLWRSVWAVDPRLGEPVVIKMMKQQHDVTDRNLDRHRRDALVMERLTSSPYVVDIHGFCGNSVLTEYIGLSLEDVITLNMTTPATRLTPEGRLRLALDSAKGLQALHDVEGGPIVHADIQAKQFLVDPRGRVKVNDFNRCRFTAHRNDTVGETCPFRIPTAPGKRRAPEEYGNRDLNEKLDIFSLANIYHSIISGLDPWEAWSSAEVKKAVQKGMKPLADANFTMGATDKLLQNLTLRAFEFDADKRISAFALVRELEKALHH